MTDMMQYYVPLVSFIARTSPNNLIIIGVVCTAYGLYLIKRGIEGDTLCPGTLFTYLPRWLFIVTGVCLQIPLPAAVWYVNHAKSLLN